MNAAEARKKRAGTTLTDRVMRDPQRAARIEKLVKVADIEQLVESAMAIRQVSAAELARRLNAKPPQISRDLHGGLRKATLARVVTIAEALGYDFVPALVPREQSAEREKFFEAYSALIPPAPKKAGQTVARKASTGKRARTTARKRRVA